MSNLEARASAYFAHFLSHCLTGAPQDLAYLVTKSSPYQDYLRDRLSGPVVWNLAKVHLFGERFWAWVIHYKDGVYQGTVENDSRLFRHGQVIEFTANEVYDIAYTERKTTNE